MYSSGTTGKPKCIVHGAGGTLLQHFKELHLHTDLKREDKIAYYTTCGWMMWNWLISSLQLGASVVLIDGSPVFPDNEIFGVKLKKRRLQYLELVLNTYQVLKNLVLFQKKNLILVI